MLSSNEEFKLVESLNLPSEFQWLHTLYRSVYSLLSPNPGLSAKSLYFTSRWTLKSTDTSFQAPNTFSKGRRKAVDLLCQVEMYWLKCSADASDIKMIFLYRQTVFPASYIASLRSTEKYFFTLYVDPHIHGFLTSCYHSFRSV